MKYKDRKDARRKYKQAILATVATMSLGVSALGGTTSAFAAETPKVESIGQGATVSKNYSVLESSNGIKTALSMSIVKDPNSNKQRAIISTEGSRIPANKTQHNHTSSQADITWASSYDVQMKLPGGQQAKFHEVAPADEIKDKTVKSTIGYKIGGDVQTSGAGKLAGEMNWSTDVSYSQADYITRLRTNSANMVHWTVPFMSAMNQGYGPYTQESSDFPYGNQLFMKSRTKNNAEDNFISDQEMPALASNGFSPGMVAVVEVSKDSEELTDFTVTYARHSDKYELNWWKNPGGILVESGFVPSIPSHWTGYNTPDVDVTEASHSYKIDWKNQKLIEQS
ncbi:leukocidin family pore-forming toxin [Bacillus cereus]|uniref:leukocidin family pore-forming toxin n=1 Tax=Bacillus cereus TaxID=1396 RepID=UPI00397F2554